MGKAVIYDSKILEEPSSSLQDSLKLFKFQHKFDTT